MATVCNKHDPDSGVQGEVRRGGEIAAQNDGMPSVVELEHVDLEADGVGHVKLVADPVDGDGDGRPGAGQHDVGRGGVGGERRRRVGLAEQGLHVHLAGLGVGPEQQVLGVVEVEARGARRVGHELLVGPRRVHAPHGPVVGEQQLQRAVRVARRAVGLPRQPVAVVARARVRAVRVGAKLVAEAPLLALVSVYARPGVVGNLPALGAVAGPSRQRSLALVLASERRAAARRAGGLLVGTVGAVPLAVAELRALDALGRVVGAALGAEELVLRARRGRAVELVRAVRAVPVAVAVERHRDAERVGAPELTHVAGGEVAVLLVAAVLTVRPVVALEAQVHALGAVRAPELVQLAGDAGAGAALLVATVAAVQVAVAPLVLGQAQPRIVRAGAASEVVRLTLPVRALSLVSAVHAVHLHVAALVRRDAVGLVEHVLAAGQVAGLALGRRTGLVFVLRLLAVLLVVAHRQLRDALALRAPEHVWAALICRSGPQGCAAAATAAAAVAAAAADAGQQHHRQGGQPGRRGSLPSQRRPSRPPAPARSGARARPAHCHHQGGTRARAVTPSLSS